MIEFFCRFWNAIAFTNYYVALLIPFFHSHLHFKLELLVMNLLRFSISMLLSLRRATDGHLLYGTHWSKDFSFSSKVSFFRRLSQIIITRTHSMCQFLLAQIVGIFSLF